MSSQDICLNQKIPKLNGYELFFKGYNFLLTIAITTVNITIIITIKSCFIVTVIFSYCHNSTDALRLMTSSNPTFS